ncbi:MAG: ABC transporter permease, partial [Thermoplasmata archaeon]|nr:ABC transporter permease [Thermoplasmata archaeon]
FTHIAVANPCVAWAGPKASPSAIAACQHLYGLDKPLPVQFANYLKGLVSGDWGYDPLYQVPVLTAIQQYFPATLELVLASIFLMVVVGIPLGVVAAASNGRIADHIVRIFYLSGWATPTYIAGAVLAIGVGSALGISGGAFSTLSSPVHTWTHMSVIDSLIALNPSATGDALAHLLLPATALAFINMGIATRMTRSSMLETLPLDFVKTARMKGLGEFVVLYKHALRNALITTTTVLGITAGTMVSGTVVVESIFRWPGMGLYAFSAITDYDFNGTIGVVIFFAIVVVVANLVADVLYGVLDPRVEWR